MMILKSWFHQSPSKLLSANLIVVNYEKAQSVIVWGSAKVTWRYWIKFKRPSVSDYATDGHFVCDRRRQETLSGHWRLDSLAKVGCELSLNTLKWLTTWPGFTERGFYQSPRSQTFEGLGATWAETKRSPEMEKGLKNRKWDFEEACCVLIQPRAFQ